LQIQLLSATQVTKQSAKGTAYTELEVAYKNLTYQGKVESKKLMSFGANKAAFDVLAVASPPQVFDVEVVKNDKGFNDWLKVTKSNSTATTAEAPSTKATAGSATPGKSGGWETPEERKAKQVYIVRQSSLGHAIECLKVGSKVHLDPNEVIEYARKFESFVFDVDSNPGATIAKEVKKLDGFEDDLDVPF
jgi:hypothetical protein